jgi:hypothetical protein
MIIYTILLFGGIAGLTLYPFILLHPDLKNAPRALEQIKNHERIHIYQWTDLMVVSFAVQLAIWGLFGEYSFWILFLSGYLSRYVWYGVEWIVRMFQVWKDSDGFWDAQYNAYMEISLEKEAYANDEDPNYLKRIDGSRKRKPFAWLKYL